MRATTAFAIRPADRDEDQTAGLDFGRVAQTLDGLVGDERGHREEREAVDRRREHLGAVEAEGPLQRVRPAREPHAHERQRKRHCIGKDVSNVRQQRKRPGRDAAPELDDGSREDDANGDGEAAAVGRLVTMDSGGLGGHRLRVAPRGPGATSRSSWHEFYECAELYESPSVLKRTSSLPRPGDGAGVNAL